MVVLSLAKRQTVVDVERAHESRPVIVGGIARRLPSTPQCSAQRSRTAVLGGERVCALVVDRCNGVL
jgi:hypothetical protein